MKNIFTLVILLNLCFRTLWGYSANGNQDRSAQVPLKISTSVVSNDTFSQNTFYINGKENVVSINNTNITANKGKIVLNKNKTAQTIDIIGEANSANIQQIGHNGSVNIHQNGNGNQVNANQSISQDQGRGNLSAFFIDRD